MGEFGTAFGFRALGIFRSPWEYVELTMSKPYTYTLLTTLRFRGKTSSLLPAVKIASTMPDADLVRMRLKKLRDFQAFIAEHQEDQNRQDESLQSYGGRSVGFQAVWRGAWHWADVLRKIRPQEQHVDEALWKATQCEIDQGWLSKPLSVQEALTQLGPSLCPARRFGLTQKAKARPMDDYTVSGANLATTTKYTYNSPKSMHTIHPKYTFNDSKIYLQ
eukprot:5738682-Amphidinium_carterae.1